MTFKRFARLSLCCLFVAAQAGANAPSFNILGSYFPAWMLCALISILLAVLLYLVVRRVGLQESFEPAIITYPCLTAFFSFSLWLILFR